MSTVSRVFIGVCLQIWDREDYKAQHTSCQGHVIGIIIEWRHLKILEDFSKGGKVIEKVCSGDYW